MSILKSTLPAKSNPFSSGSARSEDARIHPQPTSPCFALQQPGKSLGRVQVPLWVPSPSPWGCSPLSRTGPGNLHAWPGFGSGPAGPGPRPFLGAVVGLWGRQLCQEAAKRAGSAAMPAAQHLGPTTASQAAVSSSVPRNLLPSSPLLPLLLILLLPSFPLLPLFLPLSFLSSSSSPPPTPLLPLLPLPLHPAQGRGLRTNLPHPMGTSGQALTGMNTIPRATATSQGPFYSHYDG